MRGRGPGWEEGDLQAFLKLGSDNDNFYLYRAPAKSTTWEPEFVIDLETLPAAARRRRESLAQRAAALGRRRVRHARMRGLRRVRRAVPGARPRPRDQSAKPGGGAGDLGWNLPGGRDRYRPRGGALGGRHPAERAGITDRHRGLGRRAARRLRCRRLVGRATSSGTGSSGRSTRTRRTGARTCCRWPETSGSIGSCRTDSGSRCR